MTDHSTPYLCPACGYDIVPSEEDKAFLCSECGKATSHAESSRETRERLARRFRFRSVAGVLGWPVGAGAMLFAYRATPHLYPEDSDVFVMVLWFFLVPILTPLVIGTMLIRRARLVPPMRELIPAWELYAAIGLSLIVSYISFKYGWR